MQDQNTGYEESLKQNKTKQNQKEKEKEKLTSGPPCVNMSFIEAPRLLKRN